MTAASDVIGIDDVLDARIASGGRTSVGAPEDVLLHVRVLDDRLDHEIGGDELVDAGHARRARRRVARRPSRRACVEALLASRSSAALDRARSLVVERDAPPGGRHDLGDAAAHLPGADDEDVLEPHARSISARAEVRPGGRVACPRLSRRSAQSSTSARMTIPTTDLDDGAARLAALGHERAGLDDAAGGGEPGSVRRAGEQQPDRLVHRDDRRRNPSRTGVRTWSVRSTSPLDALLDVDGEKASRRAPFDRPSARRRRVRRPLRRRSSSRCESGSFAQTHAAAGLASASASERDEEERLQTSISSASPCPPPEQIAASPRPPPLRRRSCTSVADDPPARRADRMPERDRAAVDVHDLLVGAEHPRSSSWRPRRTPR